MNAHIWNCVFFSSPLFSPYQQSRWEKSSFARNSRVDYKTPTIRCNKMNSFSTRCYTFFFLHRQNAHEFLEPFLNATETNWCHFLLGTFHSIFQFLSCCLIALKYWFYLKKSENRDNSINFTYNCIEIGRESFFFLKTLCRLGGKRWNRSYQGATCCYLSSATFAKSILFLISIMANFRVGYHYSYSLSKCTFHIELKSVLIDFSDFFFLLELMIIVVISVAT